MFLARNIDPALDPAPDLVLAPMDQRELALSGLSLSENIKACSGHVGALYLSNDPADVTGYYGIEYALSDPVTYGIPWLLTDGRIFEQFPKSATRAAKAWVEYQLSLVHLLFNVVHQDHTRTIKWLEALGFTIGYNNPTEIKGEFVLTFWQYSKTLAPIGGSHV